ncbi:OmpA family protein [Mucilaginibacter rubeus]|uniref:OmpA family protein n=1 Tax=Mucilaginibacter rubeus TaxID=2027860 RepID=A0AAE6JM02_9SPHI|nr:MULTISPECIES: OmpA family protein [Mucilaginibacter]QEM07200.1 OmpA family protein [Mucilaginibacter rubeus]QEM19656.1 OmpA family protein [Mucilaginibacter gossypii]QTE43648.1 OmpA family protein [Mucilaginibacter rubeus]QTE50248.1 OmpA family protein [Mucilaginibacter rubeus]QTE55336.1 OmpA family protein [Mucilaginibacter rubeus]
MKKYLTIAFTLSSTCVFAQVVQTPGGVVDLKTEMHYGGYLRDKSHPDKQDKIIWYPTQKLYRPCAKYDQLLEVPSGFKYVDVDCNCTEAFPYRFGPASAYQSIHFEENTAVLSASSYAILDSTAADLKNTHAKVVLGGYAANEGTAAQALSLAKDRANSVKTYLVNAGVDARLIKVKGYGETKPVADNSTEEGRVANRRVEFQRQ